KLAEAARQGLDAEPLNAPPLFGGPPIARRLALSNAPIYDHELVRVAYGTNLAGNEASAPWAAVPLIALGRHVGLLVLHAGEDTAPLAPDRRAALEAVAAVLALVLTVRGLERKMAATTSDVRAAGDLRPRPPAP